MHSITTSAFSITVPAELELPLVLDSPHSGFQFPDNFRPSASMEVIRTGWDAYLEDLWGSATALGATLIAANVSRGYIDLNRAPDDIDQALLGQTWPGPCHPSESCRRGMGLIRRLALPEVPMYDRLLTAAEVEARLRDYYLPYRAILREAIETVVARHGRVWHLDLHSMKSRGNRMNIDAGQPRPDLVISDRLGQTSHPAVTGWIADQFRNLGYRVNINAPYQGGDIVHTYGAPARGRNSIQIEINRAIYLDETTCEKNPNYGVLKQDINRFLEGFAEKIRHSTMDFS